VQPRRVQFDVAKDNDLYVRFEDVGEKPLVHPAAPDGAARVPDRGVKDGEPAPPRRGELRTLDFPEHGGLGPGTQRRDRLHAAPVFIAERKPIQQVLDCLETRALEIGRLTRTDAFQKLE
jgi:hypothetical protein